MRRAARDCAAGWGAGAAESGGERAGRAADSQLPAVPPTPTPRADGRPPRVFKPPRRNALGTWTGRRARDNRNHHGASTTGPRPNAADRGNTAARRRSGTRTQGTLAPPHGRGRGGGKRERGRGVGRGVRMARGDGAPEERGPARGARRQPRLRREPPTTPGDPRREVPSTHRGGATAEGERPPAPPRPRQPRPDLSSSLSLSLSPSPSHTHTRARGFGTALLSLSRGQRAGHRAGFARTAREGGRGDARARPGPDRARGPRGGSDPLSR